ncbi:MAG: thioredoxin family protein [Verrucomicrobiota bacterium]
MQFVNYYSGLIAAGLLLAVGVARVVRCGGKLRDWLILGGVLAVVFGTWFYLRPVASGLVDASGRPVLLEVQSPYCLGCVAVKPAVDRLENELREKLVVRRVDIQSTAGRQLVAQYRIEVTPTFILFDSAGKELWRGTGNVDAEVVRDAIR